MRWLISYLQMLVLLFVLLMPAAISRVAITSWSMQAKKVVITLMVVLSAVFTVIVLIREHPDRTTEIIGSIAWALYLLLVIASAKYYWPR
jgi:hypothetical protein